MTVAIKFYFSGLKFVFDGNRLMFSGSGLWKWAVIPFLIDIAMIIWGVFWGIGNIGELVAAGIGYLIDPSAGIWYSIIYYPLAALFWVGFLIMLIYAVFLVATVVASPFNSLLAERALMQLNAIEQKPFKFGRWLVVSVKMIVASLVRAAIFAVIGVVIFVLSFVPVVNVAGSFAALLIIAFDSADYSFEILEWDLKKRFAFFREAFAEFSGMASFLALTLVIPGLTLLVLPSSVVGAAIVIANRKGQGAG